MNGIYARQSLDKKDSLSIETQIELCRNEILGEESVVYIDKGFSGKNTNRPQFQRMMDDVVAKKLNKIVVYKLDRLSRSLLDFATMIDLFNKHNVSFVSAREKFDTTTPIGNAMLSIIMVFAQLERETIQLRVRDAYHSRLSKGAYDGLAPYGYEKCKDYSTGKSVSTIRPNKTTAVVVQSIFDEYAYTPISLGELAKKLNSQGIISPRNAMWDSCKLSRIMLNPIYVKADISIYNYYKDLNANLTNPPDDYIGVNGCVTYGDWDRKRRKFDQMSTISMSIGLHQGLIHPVTFLRVQEKLRQNKQINNAKKGSYSWLTGLIKCGYCGHALVVKKEENGRRWFECSGKTNFGTCKQFVSRPTISEVEHVVEEQLFEAIRKKEKRMTRSSHQLDGELQEKRIAITKIEEKLNHLVDVLSEGGGSSDTILARISSLESEKKQLEQTITKMSYSVPEETLSTNDIIAKWDEMDIHYKREVLRTVADRISVFNDKILISWKYDFSR